MRWNIAALTLMDEIRSFFGTRGWKLDVTGDGLTASNYELDLKVKVSREKVNFRVIAEAKDDPADRLDTITSNPTKELSNFFSAGVPGGKEVFESYASSPYLISGILRRAATRVKKLGPKRIAAFIKQALIVLDLNEFITKVAAYGEVETEELANQMKKKGWKLEEFETDAGRAGIKINFHDLYDATIYPESVEYEYEYVIDGYPKSMYWGTSEDPIRAFEDWVKTDNFNEAVDERNADIDEDDKSELSSDAVMETVKPGKKKELEHAKTVPSKK